MSCVTKDIKEPGDYGGFPAVRIIYWFYVCIFTPYLEFKDSEPNLLVTSPCWLSAHVTTKSTNVWTIIWVLLQIPIFEWRRQIAKHSQASRKKWNQKVQASFVCYGLTSYKFGDEVHAVVKVSAAITSILWSLADLLVDNYCGFCFFPLKDYPLLLIRLLLSLFNSVIKHCDLGGACSICTLYHKAGSKTNAVSLTGNSFWIT